MARKVGLLKRTLLFLVTEDWYFVSHRFSLAKAAKAAGYEIVVVTQVSRYADDIRAEGFRLIPIVFPRSIRRPWRDIRTLISIFRIYREIKPDIIHHVALKPVVYGSLMALFIRRNSAGSTSPVIINAMTGLGFVFTSQSLFARTMRILVIPLLRFLLRRKNSHVILQNRDDMEMLISGGFLNPEQVSLIRGSGVNTEKFKPHPEPDGMPIVLLVARMLHDKGVDEFVDAARQLRKDGIQARFVLVGGIDTENPSGIPAGTLVNWQKQGVIEWWGRRDNMPEVYHQAHVVCLPSYREGLPKVLLEAAACGRPIVATDVPGCREVVIDGENGLLVPVKDVDALADALKKLIEHPEMRKQMGAKGRALVEREFSEGKIVRETLQLYGRLLEESQNSRHCEG